MMTKLNWIFVCSVMVLSVGITISGCTTEQNDNDGGLLSGRNITDPTALFERTVKSVVYRSNMPPINTVPGVQYFGTSVTALGDWDGDGPIAQVIAVGDGQDSARGLDFRGAVHLLFIDQNGTVLNHTRIDGDTSGAPSTIGDSYTLFGWSLASLGDLDGTGPSVAVLAVGAVSHAELVRGPDYDFPAGGIYLLYLLPDGSVLRWVTIDRTTPNGPGHMVGFHRYGAAIASLGDWDGGGGSAHTIAVGGPFDAVPTLPESLVKPTVYLHQISAEGSVLRTTTLNEDTQRMPAHKPELYSQFGRSITFLPRPKREDSLLLVSANNGGNFQRVPVPQNGELYLFRLNENLSIAEVSVINPLTQNAPPAIDSDLREGQYMSSSLISLQPLLDANTHSASYLFAVGTNSGPTERWTDYHVVALNDDLSIASHTTIDGISNNGIPSPREYNATYYPAGAYIGQFGPGPDMHAIGIAGRFGSGDDALFLHFVNSK